MQETGSIIKSISMIRKYTLLLFLTGALLNSARGQGSSALYSPEYFFRNGLDLIETSNYSSARVSFEKFVQLSTSNEDIRIPLSKYYIALCALNLYNLDAEQLFVDFIDKFPTHPKAITANYDLGNFFFQDKNYKDAVRYLTKVNYNQLSAEKQRRARFRLAYSYFSLRKFPDALKQFNMLKNTQSEYKSASAYYAAYIEYLQADYDIALVDLKLAESGKAYRSLVPVVVVNIYYRQEKFDKLIEYGRDVIENRSELSNIRDINLLVGEAYFSKKDYKNASIYYEAFKKRNKGKPTSEVALRMAITDFNLKNNEAAIAYLKLIASQKTETGIVASYYLGALYTRANNMEFAVAAYKIAANQDKDPEIAQNALFQFAKISTDLGYSLEAVTNLNRYIELYPNGNNLAEVNELLSVAYLNSKNLDLAIEHIESLKTLSTRSKEAYQKATFRKGNQMYNQHNYKEAISYYDKSLNYPVDSKIKLEANFWKSEAFSIGRLYDEAIPGYKTVLSGSDSDLKTKANYGLGYSYFNTADYKNALPNFKTYINTYKGNKKDRNYQDGLLRLADCYYALKNYPEALRLYNDVVRTGGRNRDYAYLQLGTLEGINGELLNAKDHLRRVAREFPKSAYVDDALFELASIDYERGNYQASISVFSELIDKKPNSPFVPYALQRRGIAHYNSQNYGRTEEDYREFLKKYPTHREANNVLLGLQEVLAAENKSEQFDTYLAEYKLANPDNQGLQEVEFESAKSYYNQQNYDKAIEVFTAFMEAYPEDSKSYEALFYIAESYYRKNENYNALPLYYEVLRENQVSQRLRVIQRIADLEYADRNYSKSISYYHQLEKEAFTNRQNLNAWVGLTKSFFQTGRYDSTELYANKILSDPSTNVGTQNTAYLYQGKVAYAKGNYEGAVVLFEKTISNAKDINGAEAYVLIGEVLYQQKKYKKSNEILFDVSGNFGVFDHWVGKAFLQVSENYIAMEEYLQARATLNSIIEHTPSGIIANLAKVKLDRIDDLEADQVIEPDTLSTDTIIIDHNDTTVIKNGGNEN